MTYFNDYSLALTPKSKGDVRKNFRPPSCLPVQSRPRPSAAPLQGLTRARGGWGCGAATIAPAGMEVARPPAASSFLPHPSLVQCPSNFHPRLRVTTSIPIYESPSLKSTRLRPTSLRLFFMLTSEIGSTYCQCSEANDHTDQQRTMI